MVRSSLSMKLACFLLLVVVSQGAQIHSRFKYQNTQTISAEQSLPFRVGHGYDIHRLVADGRPLIIAGVPVPFNKGVDSHSDGDVVLHSVADAVFGALGLPDIGEHFPDTDARWAGASSELFVLEAVKEMEMLGYVVANVDVTIIMEKPKLKPFKDAMRLSLASMLKTPHVNIKARTHEKVDSVGLGNAVECHVVLLLQGKLLNGQLVDL
eukprot:Platyproteum_vivax@DN5022_c0_g1_i1.p1